MSGLTPGARPRTRTSGLSDFFGGNNGQSNASRSHPPKETPLPPIPPQTDEQAESSSSNKGSKKSNIPLFFSRRKSGGAAPIPSPLKRKPTTKIAAPSSTNPPLPRPRGLSSSSTKSGKNNGPTSPTTSNPPPLPTTLPPLNVSPPSLSSKFAAHFTPSKSPAKSIKARGIYSSMHAPTSPPHSPPATSIPSPTFPRKPVPVIPAPVAVEPPSSAAETQRQSLESHRSSTSTTRPATITVSISPPEEFYKDEDYSISDRFTLPRSAPIPPQKNSPGTPGSTVDTSGSAVSTPRSTVGTPRSIIDNRIGYFDVPSPEQPLSPSPPSSPKMHFPNPPSGMTGTSQIPRSSHAKEKGKEETKPIANGGSEGLGIVSQPKRSKSRRKHSISVVKALEEALGTDLGEDLDSDSGSDSDKNTVPISDTGGGSGSSGDLDIVKPPRRISSLNFMRQKQQEAQEPLQQQQQQQSPRLQPRQRLSSPSVPSSPTRSLSTRSGASSARSSVSRSGPPPTTPLPSPPSPLDGLTPPMSSLPTIPSINSLPSRRSSALLVPREPILPRPRAQTISAVPATNSNLHTIVNSTSPRTPTSTNISPISLRHPRARPEDKAIGESITKSNKENRRKLTYEELETKFIEVSAQYATLTVFHKAISDKIESERDAAQKDAEKWRKEADLWKQEAKRRNEDLKDRAKEVDGLKWLILHPIPPRAQPDLDDASTDTGSLAESLAFSVTQPEDEAETAIVIGPPTRKRSMTIHDFRPTTPKFRRPKSNSSIQASSSSISMTGLGLDYPIPDVPYTKYILGSSTASSAASSTSSLAVPGLTAANTASSSGLSAIPELPSTPRQSSDIADDVDKQRDKVERRSSRISRRISGSSLVTPQSAVASQAYASNLKTGRGPSIEQVLDHAPPNMDDVLEKLRSFAST